MEARMERDRTPAQPPAITLLLSTSLTSDAIAASGGGKSIGSSGNSGRGVGNGGGDGNGGNGPTGNGPGGGNSGRGLGNGGGSPR